MENGKKFKTKTGYCHILKDKIVLSRDGIVGNVASVVSGNHIYQSVIIYLTAVGFLTYFLIKNYSEKSYVGIALDATLIAVLSYYIFRAFGYSATPVIERSKISQIVYKKARNKKRLIFLPGSLTNGEAIANEALDIMRSEQLIPN